MDTLVASHPNLISKVKIGSTYENRPMYALKVNRLCDHKLITDWYLCTYLYIYLICYILLMRPVQHWWREKACNLDWCWNPCQGVGFSCLSSVDCWQGEWVCRRIISLVFGWVCLSWYIQSYFLVSLNYCGNYKNVTLDFSFLTTRIICASTFILF